MELVYTVDKAHGYNWKDCVCCEDMPLLSLSAQNTIALCTTVRMDVSRSDERFHIDHEYYVYVCDIDKPWAVHKLCTVSERVVALDWHCTGCKLVVATLPGTCYVYHMKDFLMNSWYDPPCVACITKEEIIAVSWIHPGGMNTFVAEKKEASLYSEKIIGSKFEPSLSHCGGKAVDGLIAITAAGKIVIMLPKTRGAVSGEMNVQLSQLSDLYQLRVSVSDIAFDAAGGVLVATSNGMVTAPVLCYRVMLGQCFGNTMACNITCSALSSFFATCYTDTVLDESATARITHVRFVRCDANCLLLVGTGDMHGSRIELWQLSSQPVTLHRFYQSAEFSSLAAVQTWTHCSTISHASLPTSVAVPRFPVSYSSGGVLSAHQSDTADILFQYIAVAYHDGSVKLIDKHSFQPVTTTNLDTGISDVEYNAKRRKSIAYMSCMQQTLTGCVLIGIDQYSCVYVMKVMNTRDPVTLVPPVYLVGMFEYLMVSGIDAWDVLTAAKQGMVEAIQQRLLENFAQQPKEVQELYYCRLLALRASLARSSFTGQARAADCHCQLVLHAISTHFHSVLRPKMLVANEMSPSERLSLNCARNTEDNIDSVMMALSPEKKFVVETATLQSLQPLIQWVADLAVYLVTSLPVMHHGTLFAGSALLRSCPVLTTLRELLVLARTWGLICSSCLPTFATTVSGIDVLAHLFRLVTHVWLSVRESSARDFDDALIDECCTFAGQVLASPVDDGLFGRTVFIFLSAQSHSLKYTFGETPVRQRLSPTAALFPAGIHISAHRRDVVRQISLGVEPAELVRVCTRCSCMSFATSQLHFTAKSPAVRAWELRFERSCICGGQWMLDVACVKSS